MMDYPDQNSLGEKRFVWPTIPSSSPSLQENQDSRNVGSFDTTATVKSTEQAVNACEHAGFPFSPAVLRAEVPA